MEWWFGIFGCPIVDGVTPWFGTEAAVEDEASFLVFVVDVGDRDWGEMAVRYVWEGAGERGQ